MHFYAYICNIIIANNQRDVFCCRSAGQKKTKPKPKLLRSFGGSVYVNHNQCARNPETQQISTVPRTLPVSLSRNTHPAVGL